MKHYHFDTLVSTNDWAKEHLDAFAKDEFTVISADVQTKGRGRYGREWLSPKGVNLLASFCFFSKGSVDPLALTHVMAYSIIALLEKEGIHGELKWPNDVLVGGKKIAGILCETVPIKEGLAVVMGVGINVNMDAEALAQIPQPATSFFNELNRQLDIQTLLRKLIDLTINLDQTYLA